jgi:starch phosphorylase
VREYTEKYYLPLAERYLKRAAAKGALAKQIVKWEETLASNWSKIHFGQASVESANGLHQFRVQLYLNGIDSNAVRVEICAEGGGRGDPERIPMERVAPLSACADGYLYSARVSSVRPASDYTVRAIASHPDAAIPNEARLIIWQK